MSVVVFFYCFFLFKQKTAYEMRISDWSSDVCSSDLGESSSVVTCLDGHAMARRGRGGAALAVAALGSFAAGCFATLLIAFFGPLMARLAVQFPATEYFSLLVFGLVSAVILAHGSVFKAILTELARAHVRGGVCQYV